MKGSGLVESCYAFFGALVGRWIAAETYAWMPAIADWLLRTYVRLLPREIGERLLEEWRSLLYETPGNIAKLATAVDLGRTMFFIGKEARELEGTRKVESSDKNENEMTYPSIDYQLDRWQRRDWRKASRHYSCELRQNLFGQWVVLRRWGRVTVSKGQSLEHICASYEEGAEILTAVAKRRIQRGYSDA